MNHVREKKKLKRKTERKKERKERKKKRKQERAQEYNIIGLLLSLKRDHIQLNIKDKFLLDREWGGGGEGRGLDGSKNISAISK